MAAAGWDWRRGDEEGAKAMRRALRLAMIALVAGACGENPVRPSVRTVDFTLQLSSTAGQPGETIVASAQVTNTGTVGILHGESCIQGAIYVWVLNPDGTMFDNGLERPACPDGCICTTLPPGATVTGSWQFDGRVFRYVNPPGFTFAPPGIYTFVAAFDGFERREQFSWQGP